MNKIELYKMIEDFSGKVGKSSSFLPYVTPIEDYVYNSDWKIIPYDDFKLIKVSKDGFTVFKDGKYNIFIRKYGTKILRQRFTLAHEVGHIVLNHHKVYKQSNKILIEEEANIFAENILMPVDFVERFRYEDTETIARIFQVSKQMAKVRLAHIQRDKCYFNILNKWRQILCRWIKR